MMFRIYVFGVLMLCDLRNVDCTIEYRLKIYSYQLLTSNKIFNVRKDISQRKRHLHTHFTQKLSCRSAEVLVLQS